LSACFCPRLGGFQILADLAECRLRSDPMQTKPVFRHPSAAPFDRGLRPAPS